MFKYCLKQNYGFLSTTQDKGEIAEGADCFANDYHESVECGPRFGQFKHTQLNFKKKKRSK